MKIYYIFCSLPLVYASSPVKINGIKLDVKAVSSTTCPTRL